MKDCGQTDTFINGTCCQITYNLVRQAMQGESYTMDLAGRDGGIVEKAVNLGIDAHLEACFCPDRGDKYEWKCGKLCCVVSVESFPTLLRRLYEMDSDESEAQMLADVMLRTLGINEHGTLVGREALGLE
jgi:hypothetical protein